MKTMRCALATMLVLAAMLSVFVVPAYAANTTDIDFWDFTATTNNVYPRIPGRQKTDASPVYVNAHDIAQNPYVKTRVWGQNSSGSSKENCTLSNGAISNYVVCYEGIHHSIRSKVNEYGWGYVSLGFKSAGNVADTITGWWSADSGSLHTIAVYN